MRRGAEAALVGAAAAAMHAPLLHTVGWLGDEGIALDAAQRMLGGEALYRDLFEILPPGGFLVTEAWMRAAGSSLAVARLVPLGCTALSAALLYHTARAVSGSRWLATLATLAFSLSSTGAVIVGHHALATALATSAAALVVEVALRPAPAPKSAIAIGLLVGAALMVVPTRGALLALASAVVFLSAARPRRELALLAAGGAVAPSLAALWIAHAGALSFAGAAMAFAARRYPAVQRVPFGNAADAYTWPLVPLTLLAFALAASAVVLARREALADARLRAALPLALAALASSQPRPDARHLALAFPLVAPLLTWALARLCARLSTGARLAAALSCAPLLALPLAAWGRRLALDRTLPSVTLAAGTVKLEAGVSPDELVPLARRLMALPPDEGLFVYPYDPLLPFLVGRRPIGRHDLFQPGYTLPSQYRATCEAAARSAAWVVLDRRTMSDEWLRAMWPATVDTMPPERRAFEAAIERGWAPVLVGARFELRRRVEPIAPSLCRSISLIDP